MSTTEKKNLIEDETTDLTPLHIIKFRIIVEPLETVADRDPYIQKEQHLSDGGIISVEQIKPSPDQPSRETYIVNVAKKVGDNNKAPILGFQVGERGLERIGISSTELVTRDNIIPLNQGIGIGLEGSQTDSHTVPEGSEDEFANLAEPLADWLEKMIKDNKLSEPPVKLSSG